MPVTIIATLQTNNAAQLEKTVNESADADAILTSARDFGLLTHRFVANLNTNTCLVIDQWPTEQAFQDFYRTNEQTIRRMLAPVMQGEPAIQAYQNLSTRDQYPQEQAGRHAGRLSRLPSCRTGLRKPPRGWAGHRGGFLCGTVCSRPRAMAFRDGTQAPIPWTPRLTVQKGPAPWKRAGPFILFDRTPLV